MFSAGWVYQGLIWLAALLPALTFHEFAHAYTADRCGDPTPAAHGRVSLNPLAHLDPLGTLMVIFAHIGWAKPVPINPANFRHPSRDIVLTSAAGPLSNLAQGIAWCMVIRLAHAGGFLEGTFARVLVVMALINFILCIFNLIPLGPLDGHHILEYTLPYGTAGKYRAFNRLYGMPILFGAIVLSFLLNVPVLDWIVIGPAEFVFSLFSGVRLL